jgi:ATP-binding cassette subfamily B protein
MSYEEYLDQEARGRHTARAASLVLRGLGLVWRAARGVLLRSAAIQVVAGLAAGAQILLLKRAAELVILLPHDRSAVRQLVPVGLIFAALYLSVRAAESVRYPQTIVLAEYVTRETERAVLRAAATSELAMFDSAEFYDELQRASAARNKPSELTSVLLDLLNSGAALISVVVAVALVEPWALPVLLLAVVPALVSRLRVTRELFAFHVRLVPLERRINYLWSWLSGRDMAKEIRAFGLAEHLRDRWGELRDEQLELTKQVIRRLAVPQLVTLLGSSVAIFGALAFLSSLVASGHSEVSAAVAGVGAVIVAQPRIQLAVSEVSHLYDCALYLRSYERFVGLAQRRAESAPSAPAPSSFEVLRVEGVGFSYPGAPLPSLVDVSLEVGRGQIVALVGENGSGKTTLAKLLCGLYPPDAGRICWDEVDTATVDQEQLRRGVAVLFQDFARYLLSARDNIALGDCTRGADDEGVLLAGRRAGADAFLSGFPEGYDTLLGPEFEGGRDLSVGQWQRIALARAFFRGAPFIILDEPTAAMDPRAEHELFASIRELCAGRTVLLISHRFSSVRNADRIFVLHKGRLVQSGSHAELIAQGGRYDAMFRMQAAAYVAEEAAKKAEATADALADA